MTRKDYVLIAAAIKRAAETAINNVQRLGIEDAAKNIAATLAQDNPRFDRERFLKACGF